MPDLTKTKTETDRELAPGELETDHVLVRALRADDLAAVVRIDAQAIGRTRKAYYEGKLGTALEAGALQTSLAAELDDHVVGFILARLYYGEFGRTEPTAIIDSIGVDHDYHRRKVGEALMRQLTMNLRALGVEHVESLVDWDQQDLLRFFAHHGFTPAPRLCLRLALL
ncbi:MAG: GNAT family N-acetyltransferase [Polyangiaceae bacterium]